MNTSQILHRAVKIAAANGWISEVTPPPETWVVLAIEHNRGSIKAYSKSTALVWSHTFSIFDHDFAKALWGENFAIFPYGNAKAIGNVAWAYHLQEMVMADDPMKYLEEHI